MKGIAQLNPLQPFEGVAAATMADQAGIQVETDGTTSWVIGHKGSWTKTADVFFGEMSESITVAGSAEEAGTLYVMADGLDGEIAAEISYPAGEWEISASLALAQIHDVYFVFGGDATLNSWIVK